MSQLLVLAKPRSGAPMGDTGYAFHRTEDPKLVAGAKLALGVSDGDPVFAVASPTGDPFEAWFDADSFDAERTGQLIDACARNFAALAFFYGDAHDLDRASRPDELKEIIRRQFNTTPVELYAAWNE